MLAAGVSLDYVNSNMTSKTREKQNKNGNRRIFTNKIQYNIVEHFCHKKMLFQVFFLG